MPDAQSAAVTERVSPVTELKVTGHLMALAPGLHCIVLSPGRVALSGLPGVRLSLPPGPVERAGNVTISGFRDDGWLAGQGDAALVRVSGTAPAQVLVTVYQAPGGQEPAPNLQVLRLAAPSEPGRPAPLPAAAAPVQVDMVAHIAAQGDVGVRLGEWLGERGSKRWVEGFAIAPVKDIAANDIEYQAVLGRGWLSPWVEGGQFCGSRGMALPILGLRVRLRGAAAERFECMLSAAFVDGSTIGPVAAGEACESESLAPVEAFKVVIQPRGAARPVPEAEASVAAVAVPEMPARKPAEKPRVAKAPVAKPKPAAAKPVAPAPKPRRGR